MSKKVNVTHNLKGKKENNQSIEFNVIMKNNIHQLDNSQNVIVTNSLDIDNSSHSSADDINENSWETVSESSNDSNAQDDVCIPSNQKTQECDCQSTQLSENKLCSYRGNVVHLARNSTLEFLIFEINDSTDTWTIADNCSEFYAKITPGIIKNESCNSSGEEYVSNFSVLTRNSSSSVLESEALVQQGTSILFAEINVISQNNTTGKVQEKLTNSKKRKCHFRHKNAVCEVSFPKSKSNDNFMQRIDYYRDCHPAYILLKRKQFCTCDGYKKNGKLHMFSEVRSKQIGDSPTLKCKQNVCENSSPVSSILQKYIYIENPYNILTKNYINHIIKHQTFECRMVVTEELSKDISSEKEKENCTVVSGHDCGSAVTEKRQPPLEEENKTELISSSAKVSLNNEEHLKVHKQFHLPEIPQRNSNIWVILDSDGHAQEVTHQNVRVLLGESSANLVIAQNVSSSESDNVSCHRSQHANHSSDSLTTAPTPQLTKDALLLLHHESSSEEELNQQRLERKEGSTLMHITRETNIPWIRFIDVNSDTAQFWNGAPEYIRKGERFTSTLTQREIPDSNDLQKSLQHKKVTNPVSLSPIAEEELSNKYVWSEQIPLFMRRGQEQNENNQNTTKNEQLDTRGRQKSFEYFPQVKLQEDLWKQGDGKITGLMTKNRQERNAQRTSTLEKIFLYNSMQYASQALKEVQENILDLKKSMVQSEMNVKRVITQYVGNKDLERQLLRTIEQYSQKQLEGEQRLHGIAQHLIEEQMQSIRSNRKDSEEHIETLIQQNKHLEEENRHILRKLEKLHFKLKLSPSTESHTSDCNEDILSLNNEKLRNKLVMEQYNVSEFEKVHQEMLHSLEHSADELHSQKLEIENQKLMQMRNQADFNIEKAYLSSELEKSQKFIQEATDIADVVVQDLRKIKSNVGETGKRICVNWEKFKEEGASVASVLSLCHSCIQELCLELHNMHRDLTTREKELITMKKCNKQLQQVLSELETEYSTLRQHSEHLITEKISIEKQMIQVGQENSNLKEQLTKCSRSTTDLQEEIKNLQGLKSIAAENEFLKSQFEKHIQELKADKQSLAKKLITDEENGKTMEIDLMKMAALLEIYETKNKELTKTNQELREEFEKTQTSLSSLQNYPRQYEELEKNYFKVIAEKDHLNQKLNTLKTQMTEISNTNSAQSKQIQEMETELKKISKGNLEMKWETKNLKNINHCLENDNCNMLRRLEDESTKYKQKIHHSEARTHELEEKIAEQEKGIEEMKNILLLQTQSTYSLQTECDKKEGIINILEGKCHDLSISQKKDENQIFIFNHKVQELQNEMNTLNKNNTITLNSIRYEFESLETTLKITQDDLNNTMLKLQDQEANLRYVQENLQAAECSLVQKDHQINENQRTIDYLQRDLQDMNHIKDKELQNLLKDYESIVQERDKLKVDHSNLLSETETVKQNFKELQNKNDTLLKYCSLQKEQIKGMKAHLNKLQVYLSKANGNSKECIETVLQQITYDLAMHSNKSTDLEYEIDEHKFILTDKQNAHEEKSKLQSQVLLLHELNKRNSNDLKHARRTVRINEEKLAELSTRLAEEVSKRKLAEEEYASMARKQKTFVGEMEMLQKRVQQETQNCVSLSEEYYSHQKEMSEKEVDFLSTIDELKEHIERMKKELQTVSCEKNDLQQSMESKQRELTILKENNEELELKLSDYGRTLSYLAQEKRKNEQLESQLQTLAKEGHNLSTLQQLLQKQHSFITAALEGSRNELEKTREALGSLEQLERENAEELRGMKAHEQLKALSPETYLIKETEFVEMNTVSSGLQSVSPLMDTEECFKKDTRDLSQKLLKALKIIYQTKLKCNFAHEQISQLSSQIKNLKEQKVLKEEELVSLSTEIAVLTEQVKRKNPDAEKQAVDLQMQEQITLLRSKVDELQGQLKKEKQISLSDASKMEELLLIKEDMILQCKEKIHLLQEKSERLRKGLTEAQERLLSHNQEHSKLKCDMVTLQAEKRKLTLQLQVVEGYLEEEKQRRMHLEATYKTLLEDSRQDFKL